MIRNTALTVPRKGNIEFQNVPKASVFCLGDSFLPFLPPSFPLPIPLPALTTAVQRQCLNIVYKRAQLSGADVGKLILDMTSTMEVFKEQASRDDVCDVCDV